MLFHDVKCVNRWEGVSRCEIWRGCGLEESGLQPCHSLSQNRERCLRCRLPLSALGLVGPGLSGLVRLNMAVVLTLTYIKLLTLLYCLLW